MAAILVVISMPTVGAQVETGTLTAGDVTVKSGESVVVQPQMNVTWQHAEPWHVAFIVEIDGKMAGAHTELADGSSYQLHTIELMNDSANSTAPLNVTEGEHTITVKTAIVGSESNWTGGSSFEGALATTEQSATFNVTVPEVTASGVANTSAA